LDGYLISNVFAGALETVETKPIDVAGFCTFIKRFRAALPVQRAAAHTLRRTTL
jgi:hypothetical protein